MPVEPVEPNAPDNRSDRAVGATQRVARPLRRVVVTGSECTGKTTLARHLAERFATVWVPEHARAYAERQARDLTADDVEPIARGQIDAEDGASARARRLIVLDTDLVSTLVYARHYYDHRPDWLLAAAWQRRGDLYLLCHPDVPWVADGVRDRPRAREELHAAFVAQLAALDATVVAIRGDWTAREATAGVAVQALLDRDPAPSA